MSGYYLRRPIIFLDVSILCLFRVSFLFLSLLKNSIPKSSRVMVSLIISQVTSLATRSRPVKEKRGGSNVTIIKIKFLIVCYNINKEGHLTTTVVPFLIVHKGLFRCPVKVPDRRVSHTRS